MLTPSSALAVSVGAAPRRCGDDATAFNGVTIPPHLLYRPPKVTNDFRYVESRYKSPRKTVDAAAYYRDRIDATRTPSPTRTSEFQGVESRYRSPPKARVPPDASALTKRSEASEEHKQLSAAQGFAAVSSKYYDLHLRPPPTSTPRLAVEEKKKREAEELKRNGQPFRLVHVKETSFKDMEKGNRELRERWNSPPKRSANQHSIVMSYVKDGIAIPGHEAVPAKRPQPDALRISQQEFYGGGGAGGGSFFRRTNSPTKMQSGVEEGKVQKLASALQSARSKSPPRVAALQNRLAKAAAEERTAASLQRGGGITPLRRTTSPTPKRRPVTPPLASSNVDEAAPTAASSGAAYFKREPPPTLFDTQPPKLAAIR